MDSTNLKQILDDLKSSKRIDRDKGLSELKKVLQANTVTLPEVNHLQTALLHSLTSSSAWEEKHGAVCAAKLLVPGSDEQWLLELKKELPQLLKHSEIRVGVVTGELLGALCQRCGVVVYQELQECLMAGIKENIHRDLSSVDPELMHKLGTQDKDTFLKEEATKRASSPVPAHVLHDTAGWKSLETYMNALKNAVESSGASFSPYITSELLELLFTVLHHTNRFVRETGYHVLVAVVSCPAVSQETVEVHWPVVASQIAEGLADNWSQVRMAASVACRKFLLSFESKEEKSLFLPTLLPPMCLNRYYVAEGVKLYSQESWRQVTQGGGVGMVQDNISAVVQYYILQSQAANHAVREAACACIAELGNKVAKEFLRAHVSSLLETLIECFKDDSWPVRDTACLACGNFIISFPEESRSFINDLFTLSLANFEDSIPSVRQGAAITLAGFVTAYGADMQERVVEVVKERLPLAAQQAHSSVDDSVHHPGIDPSPAQFGVVRRTATEEDIEAHSNQQMYSCGSLAPKMMRGGGGCSNCHFHKPAQLWEKSEGCVHLLAELSKVKSCEAVVSSLLPSLAEVTRHRQYKQHTSLLETVMKQLPALGKALGKRQFKKHIELFFDAMFYSLTSESPQLRVAGSECLLMLTRLLGKMIMRGRIEQHNPNFLSSFDQQTALI